MKAMPFKSPLPCPDFALSGDDLPSVGSIHYPTAKHKKTHDNVNMIIYIAIMEALCD